MDEHQSTIIYDDVKSTIAANSKDLLELVNEKIYNKFSSVFCKHPVIIVKNQVPPDVLKWYETHFSKQTDSIRTERLDEFKPMSPETLNIKMHTILV